MRRLVIYTVYTHFLSAVSVIMSTQLAVHRTADTRRLHSHWCPTGPSSGSAVPEGDSVWESTRLPLPLFVPAACLGERGRRGRERGREAGRGRRGGAGKLEKA